MERCLTTPYIYPCSNIVVRQEWKSKWNTANASHVKHPGVGIDNTIHIKPEKLKIKESIYNLKRLDDTYLRDGHVRPTAKTIQYANKTYCCTKDDMVMGNEWVNSVILPLMLHWLIASGYPGSSVQQRCQCSSRISAGTASGVSLQCRHWCWP